MSNETEFGLDILTIAVEGGIGYWFQITSAERTDDLDWVAITGRELDDDGGFSGPEHTLHAKDLPSAADRLAKSGSVRADIASDIRRALRESDASYIDSEIADCIVQFAMLGDVVYG